MVDQVQAPVAGGAVDGGLQVQWLARGLDHQQRHQQGAWCGAGRLQEQGGEMAWVAVDIHGGFDGCAASDHRRAERQEVQGIVGTALQPAARGTGDEGLRTVKAPHQLGWRGGGDFIHQQPERGFELHQVAQKACQT